MVRRLSDVCRLRHTSPLPVCRLPDLVPRCRFRLADVGRRGHVDEFGQCDDPETSSLECRQDRPQRSCGATSPGPAVVEDDHGAGDRFAEDVVRRVAGQGDETVVSQTLGSSLVRWLPSS